MDLHTLLHLLTAIHHWHKHLGLLQVCYPTSGDKLLEGREQDIQLKALQPGEGQPKCAACMSQCTASKTQVHGHVFDMARYNTSLAVCSELPCCIC